MTSNKRNLGRPLETLINYTHKQYQNKGLALIEKVPNSWVVHRRGKRIISAHPDKKTGVDYIGVTHGRAIAVEAKSTTTRTRFDLSMLREHQVAFLKQFQDQGGIAVIILEFAKLEEIYYMPFDFVYKYIEVAEKGGKKSIPYEDIQFNCELVKSSKGFILHYLPYAITQLKGDKIK